MTFIALDCSGRDLGVASQGLARPLRHADVDGDVIVPVAIAHAFEAAPLVVDARVLCHAKLKEERRSGVGNRNANDRPPEAVRRDLREIQHILWKRIAK